MFYVETQSGRKPHNSFCYMSLKITFIGSTNFLCFPFTTGRRLQLPSFSGYNLKESPNPQFFGFNPKEIHPPMFSGYNQKVDKMTCPFPIQLP
jgi:hypothetical protein